MSTYLQAAVLTGWAILMIAGIIGVVVLFDKITDRYPWFIFVAVGLVTILLIYMTSFYLVMS